MLMILSDQETPVYIRHLIVEGSSPWVIGRNVTNNANIYHLEGSFLEFTVPSSGVRNTLALTDYDTHSYLRRERLFHANFPSVQDLVSASLCASSASLS